MRTTLQYFAVTICLIACTCYAQEAGTPAQANDSVSPTAGESWLSHIHRSFGDTSMGKTGRLGPNPSNAALSAAAYEDSLLESSQGSSVTLTGADLFRLNCQACHGEKGTGAPPEINSIIDPVRATSVALVMERMKKTGMDITPAAASELAKQSQAALLERLHKGGQTMPPFAHLNDAEIRALLAYLNQLAGVPGAKQLTVTESRVRVGEHIVKSTCHICHDAAGANPDPQELEDGVIPPLATLTSRTDELQLIRKVTEGAPITMGTPPTPHRGRMPVFYYFKPQEAADVYLYLTVYPPSRLEKASAGIAAVQQSESKNPPPSGPPLLPHKNPPSTDGLGDGTVTLLLLGLGALSLTLAIGGLAFVAFELHRLGQNGEARPAGFAPHHVIETSQGELAVHQSNRETFALR
jgi:mono/diheme cytochrome c family protein